MRVRWIAVAFFVGSFFAWTHASTVEGYLTVGGCLFLWAIRSLEGEVRRLWEATEKARFPDPGIMMAFQRPKELNGNATNIFAGDEISRRSLG